MSRTAGALAWLALGAVGLVLARLGRFYEARAGRRTHYRILAAGAFGVILAGVWDAYQGCGVGAWLPSVLLAVSGLVVGWSARHLFGLMLDGPN